MYEQQQKEHARLQREQDEKDRKRREQKEQQQQQEREQQQREQAQRDLEMETQQQSQHNPGGSTISNQTTVTRTETTRTQRLQQTIEVTTMSGAAPPRPDETDDEVQIESEAEQCTRERDHLIPGLSSHQQSPVIQQIPLPQSPTHRQTPTTLQGVDSPTQQSHVSFPPSSPSTSVAHTVTPQPQQPLVTVLPPEGAPIQQHVENPCLSDGTAPQQAITPVPPPPTKSDTQTTLTNSQSHSTVHSSHTHISCTNVKQLSSTQISNLESRDSVITPFEATTTCSGGGRTSTISTQSRTTSRCSSSNSSWLDPPFTPAGEVQEMLAKHNRNAARRMKNNAEIAPPEAVITVFGP
eukprot:TRINITY_DN60227_c0_g1_i1.p1 TRINITY_DN60227_c0_g1~~TRINITY_DN60227_c0_g1_i1.p1  ORF type:complete len:414 (-),score=63.50 TRINITY_DN60227_c0_g1_i1:1277-2332(-)